MRVSGIGDLFSGRELKAQAVAGLLTAFTGEYPKLKREDNFISIKLSEKQILKGQNLLKQMLGAEPGEIRIEGINDIMTPVFIRKYIGWVIGIPAALILLGGLIKK